LAKAAFAIAVSAADVSHWHQLMRLWLALVAVDQVAKQPFATTARMTVSVQPPHIDSVSES
jgi:hypothetical protein